MRSLLVLSAVLGVSLATTGFDAIGPISTSSMSCMKSNGHQFFIGRVYHSNGVVDTEGFQNMKNAAAGGIPYVDGYIFPCTYSGCPSTTKQIQDTVNGLKNNGVKWGMLWLDIETYKWPADKTANRNTITALGNELTAQGVNWGVYTNANNWASIVGSDWTGMSSKQLWYARYDNAANFNDFAPFGGWTKPNIKQYEGDANGPCSFQIDYNWYP